jgi:hypothetical protein
VVEVSICGGTLGAANAGITDRLNIRAIIRAVEKRIIFVFINISSRLSLL